VSSVLRVEEGADMVPNRPAVTGNMFDQPDRSVPPICADMGGVWFGHVGGSTMCR
jgi:hypothetical protein